MNHNINKFINKLFDSIFSELDKKDKIWLSIDMLSIVSNLNIRKRNDIEKLLNILFESLEIYSRDVSTLIIPSFYFGFPKNKFFDTEISKPELGSFPNYLFQRKYKYRSLHPFYSFYIFGENKLNFIEKTEMLNDSVGEKSIFNFINKRKFKLVSLGHHFASALSSIHECEHFLGVDYRSEMFFDGSLIDKNRDVIHKGSFNFYGRKKEICSFSGITKNGLKKIKGCNISSQNLFQMDNSCIGYYFLDLNKFNNYIVKNHRVDNILFDYVSDLSDTNKEVITPKISLELYKKYLFQKNINCI